MESVNCEMWILFHSVHRRPGLRRSVGSRQGEDSAVNHKIQFATVLPCCGAQLMGARGGEGAGGAKAVGINLWCVGVDWVS